jgi:hypothetical protein
MRLIWNKRVELSALAKYGISTPPKQMLSAPNDKRRYRVSNRTHLCHTNHIIKPIIIKKIVKRSRYLTTLWKNGYVLTKIIARPSVDSGFRNSEKIFITILSPIVIIAIKADEPAV